MALKKIHHTDAHKKAWHARKKMHADALKLMLGQRNEVGPAHTGGHHPNQEPSGCTSYFYNRQDAAKIGGGLSTAEEAVSFKWKMQWG